MPANVSAIGPLTNTELRASPVPISDSERGTWGYVAGTNGTVNIAAGRRVLAIQARSTAGGTVTVNGGDSVSVAAGSSLTIQPKGNLVAPTIVFSAGITSYLVESVV
jgi:hypothetical protein